MAQPILERSAVVDPLLKDSFTQEFLDVKSLILNALAVPLAWLAFMGWNFDFLAAGQDGASQITPLFAKLAQNSSNWQRLAFEWDWLGGVDLLDQSGAPLLYRLLANTFEPATAVNLLVFSFQVLFGFLGLRMIRDFSTYWFGRD